MNDFLRLLYLNDWSSGRGSAEEVWPRWKKPVTGDTLRFCGHKLGPSVSPSLSLLPADPGAEVLALQHRDSLCAAMLPAMTTVD